MTSENLRRVSDLREEAKEVNTLKTGLIVQRGSIFKKIPAAIVEEQRTTALVGSHRKERMPVRAVPLVGIRSWSGRAAASVLMVAIPVIVIKIRVMAFLTTILIEKKDLGGREWVVERQSLEEK